MQFTVRQQTAEVLVICPETDSHDMPGKSIHHGK